LKISSKNIGAEHDTTRSPLPVGVDRKTRIYSMKKKHPKGLAILFFTEMWERFGFYIIMAVFVLYMDKEFGWSDSRKGDFYGWFLGAVYFIPLIGGWIGDRFMGQINTIRFGAISMLFGYVCLAVSSLDRIIFFFIGLILIAWGTGIFKVNMSVLVGNLYREKPELKDAGFNIYYMGVNVGAALAPLAATVIYNIFHNYQMSFWAAAAGLIICLIIIQAGKKSLYGADNLKSPRLKNDVGSGIDDKNYVMPKKEVRERIATLITLFIIVIFFWVAFYQNGFALTLFAERSTRVFSFLRPETYQFFNPFFILVLTPVLLSYFGKLAHSGKEPSTPVKIFIGMLIMGISMLVMVWASAAGGDRDGNNMSPVWLVTTYFLVTLSEIMISPMGQSFVSKVSPKKIQGLMMGGWFAATALGSYASGLLGKFYSDFSHHEYFLILTGLLFFSAVLVLLFLKKLKRFAA
jgi:POT family proton-dependent oligopeptide transporter